MGNHGVAVICKGKVLSEVLVLGVPDAAGEVVLIVPEQDVPLGGRLF